MQVGKHSTYSGSTSRAMKDVIVVSNEIISRTALEDVQKEQHHVEAKVKILFALIQISSHAKLTRLNLQTTHVSGQ